MSGVSEVGRGKGDHQRGNGIGKVLLKNFQNLDLSDSSSSSSSCGFQKLDHYSQAYIPGKHSSEIYILCYRIYK